MAKKAGVSISTVCDVLRNRQDGKIQVSEKTKQLIYDAVAALDYQPQAAGRALSTGRTYNIGFVLSSKTALGLTNNYYSAIMSGVAEACKQRGYNCTVGTYDMSTAKDFVAPSKLRSRSVDALVICGVIEDSIVRIFVEYDIPFVLVGQGSTYPREGILSVSEDIKSIWINAFKYLYSMGHRSIQVGGISSPRLENFLAEAVAAFRKQGAADTTFCTDTVELGTDPIVIAREAGINWTKKTESERPTAVIGNSHFCAGFLSSLKYAGFDCPRDISIFSTTDELVCQLSHPAFTALSTPLYENGMAILNLLVDSLEEKAPMSQIQKAAKKLWNPGEIIIRDSVRKLS